MSDTELSSREDRGAVGEDPDPVGRVREAAGRAGIPRTFR